MVPATDRLQLGQQPPPPGGYTIERFEGYLDEMSLRLGRMQAAERDALRTVARKLCFVDLDEAGSARMLKSMAAAGAAS